MSPQRWDRLKALFGEAWERPANERAVLLDSACAGDAELRREVEGLLAADPALGAALDEPSWDVAPDSWPDLDESGDEEPALLSPGAQVGRFRVVRMIGRGGMGEVYEAEQESPARRVALKVIRPAAWSRRAARRLTGEAATLARLDHPGIARVIEAGVTRDAAGVERPFIAMDLVDGPPITRYAAERGLGVAERVDLVRRVCEAVEHAHRRGVIHRDLKPGNILVDGEGRPRVLDFGVARAVGADAAQTRDSGFLPGTLAYMSPEQATGDPDAAETRSDVYALGVVLYELLTGRHPHAPLDRPPLELLRAIREDDPARAGSAHPALRGDLEAVLAAALAKAPSRRYGSAAALGEDLGRWLRHEPVSVGPEGALYAARRFVRRHRLASAAAGGALAALVVGAGVATWQAVRATRAEARAERRLDAAWTLIRHNLSEYGTRVIATGSFETAERLVAKTLEAVDLLEADTRATPDRLRDVAYANCVMGRLLGGPRSPNLGDTRAGVARLERGLSVYSRLMAGSPTDPALRSGAVFFMQDLAMAYWELGEAGPAKRAAARGWGLARASVALFPDDPELRVRLGESVAIRAQVHARYGDPGAAVACVHETVSFLDSLPPLAGSARGYDALAMQSAAEAAALLGEHSLAIPLLRRVIAQMQGVLVVSPAAQWLESIGGCRRHLAVSLLASGDGRAALEASREAVAAYDEYMDRWPGSSAVAEVRRWALRFSAERMREMGDHAGAARTATELIRSALASIEDDPRNVKGAASLCSDGVGAAEILAGAAAESSEPAAGRAAWLVTAERAFLRAAEVWDLANPTPREEPEAVTKASLRRRAEECQRARQALAESPG